MENNNWISISSGLFPEDREDVQVTYLGYYDEKPYCDNFAYIKNGIWYWSADDEKVGVKITAWKKNCEPYNAK